MLVYGVTCPKLLAQVCKEYGWKMIIGNTHWDMSCTALYCTTYMYYFQIIVEASYQGTPGK